MCIVILSYSEIVIFTRKPWVDIIQLNRACIFYFILSGSPVLVQQTHSSHNSIFKNIKPRSRETTEFRETSSNQNTPQEKLVPNNMFL